MVTTRLLVLSSLPPAITSWILSCICSIDETKTHVWPYILGSLRIQQGVNDIAWLQNQQTQLDKRQTIWSLFATSDNKALRLSIIWLKEKYPWNPWENPHCSEAALLLILFFFVRDLLGHGTNEFSLTTFQHFKKILSSNYQLSILCYALTHVGTSSMLSYFHLHFLLIQKLLNTLCNSNRLQYTLSHDTTFL